MKASMWKSSDAHGSCLHFAHWRLDAKNIYYFNGMNELPKEKEGLRFPSSYNMTVDMGINDFYLNIFNEWSKECCRSNLLSATLAYYLLIREN